MEIEDLKEKYANNEITKSDFIDQMYQYHDVLFQFSEDLNQTSIASIEIEDHAVIFKMKDTGVRLICERFDKRLAPLDAFNFNDYENDEITIQANLISPGDVILDIGANIGWYSLTLSKLVGNLTIHAFEPLPNTFKMLNKNIGLNQAQHIHTYNHGLSDNDGSTEFFIDPNLSVNASAKNVSGNKDITPTVCQILKLDSFVEQQKLTRIDFIKCDVEGAEFFVFKGGKDALIKHKPVVFSEMLRKWAAEFDYHPNDIIQFFQEIDYNCYKISDNQLTPITTVTEQTVETNFIFLHNEKHVELIQKYVV